MNEIERAFNIRTYNRDADSPPKPKSFTNADDFARAQEEYNKKLQTIQNYIQNTNLSDEDIFKVFGKSREEINEIKPSLLNPDESELTNIESLGSIDLQRRSPNIRRNRDTSSNVTVRDGNSSQSGSSQRYDAEWERDLMDQIRRDFDQQNINSRGDWDIDEAYYNYNNLMNQQVDFNLPDEIYINPDTYALSTGPSPIDVSEPNINLIRSYLDSMPEELSSESHDILSNYRDDFLNFYADNHELLTPERRSLLNEINTRLGSYSDVSDVSRAEKNNVKRVVPSFYATSYKSPREALLDVQKKLETGIKNSNIGDIITGSTNTSHDSYRVQMDYIFKNAGKEGLSEPVFLGYEPMNASGYLSNARIPKEDILKKINSDLNKLQKRTKKNLNLKERPPKLVQTSGGGYEIYLPHYGLKKLSENVGKLKKKKRGGAIELDLTQDQINQYIKGGYIVEQID